MNAGYIGTYGNGQFYGWFPTVSASGQGGAPTVAWVANVRLIVPTGAYTIYDPSPSTWSRNAQSGGQGFLRVIGM